MEKASKRILYLVCLENIYQSGILETQVINLLEEIGRIKSSDIDITFHAIVPMFSLNKKELSINFLKNRKKLGELYTRLTLRNININIQYVPWFNYGIYLNHFYHFILKIFTKNKLYRLCKKYNYNIIHCRSYLSASLALTLKNKMDDLSYIFDMRGFYPDEALIHKSWSKKSNSFIYWKDLENKIILNSEKIIVLSKQMKKFIIEYYNVTSEQEIKVIYPCIKNDFRSIDEIKCNIQREELNLKDSKILVFSGGLGSWHTLDALILTFKCFRSVFTNAILMILTHYNHNEIRAKFRENDIKEESFRLISLQSHEVPFYLRMSDFGVIPLSVDNNRIALFKKISLTMPTKLAEYIAAGLPVIVNKSSVGAATFVKENECGIVIEPDNINDFLLEMKNYKSKKYEKSDEEIKKIMKKFDIRENAKKYHNIYSKI